ncbi:MAG: BREX system P-loop protein BrxC, partial [Firmicutes bacterium]|nr:BREX system P-loop protein BrxC [Bacillota bacterium]
MAAIKIRDMFQQPIDRDIKGVIKVGQQEDENIKQELEEYVVTSELRKHISGFYKSFNKSLERPYDKMGVWISGFFGSGKSHLLKILSHLLENRHVDGSPSIDYIEPKLKDPLLTAEICRAAEVPKDVILFNIDSKSDSSSGPDRDTVMQVFAKVFFEMLGLCANPPWLGNMEWKLLQRGKYEEYCQAYRAITGCAWQERRRTALFEEENIAKAMVRIGLLDDSRQYGFLEHTKNFYEMSPEIFARMVSEYLDMRSPNHKIVFLVDEMGQYIAGDQRMILNLQTVAEDLGTFCKGRAWLAVTSQQAIDEIVAEVPGEDFSKILARFDTRLALSSANVDEVIKRRLLEKTPVARDTLHLLYEQKEAILRNLFTFSDNTPNQRVYESGNEFSETYPFVPYQFDVLQAVFEEVRRHGASGKHLAKGARSMLSAAQFGTLTVADHEVGALIPFSHFYDSMEEFLEPSITEVIEAAKRNNVLEQPFDVEVLKTLFMLKWTHETIPSTAENVTILMSSTLDEDKLALRQQVMVSLDRLVRQSLVQKDADLFIFLTDDEQEIDREIKRINYEPSQIARLFHEATFGASGVFPPKKIRYQKVHDFDFFQYVDGMRFGSLRAEIGISVMTPFSHGNINLDKQSILSKSALNTNQVFMVFPNDPDLREQAETSLKLETYLKQKSRTNLPYSILRILESREKQFKRSKDEFARSVERGIAQATFYADGRKLDIRSSEPSVRLTEALRTV